MRQIILMLILCITTSLGAQKPFKINGTVTDTLNNPLIASTVMLMDPDSTFIDFRNTELDGSFRFTKVAPGDYIIKSTYIGYIPLTKNVSSNGDNVDLGEMKMKEMPQELMEVVIKAAKSQIRMRGDTIEYDVSTFQVPPGATVESLLKRLPGVEVERDGTVKSEGKTVSDVTVDGKKFFSDDPKMALKNLPAAGISKVQLFDKKSEEEKVTGLKSESENKTMNLELKEDYKKGYFGQIVAGIGTKEGEIINANQYRAELKGNLNRFSKNTQLSLIGVGNNTGRNGLGWNDYQDFMGSNTFNFNRNSFGFGGGGMTRRFMFGGSSSNNIEQSIQNVFFNRTNNGFPENYNGGVNFNYNKDKSDINAVYFVNIPKLTTLEVSESKNLLSTNAFDSKQNDFEVSRSIGHRGELSWEYEIDSLNNIETKISGAYINDNNNNDILLTLKNGDDIRTKSKTDNSLNSTGNLINSEINFRKKFKKKGRRFGANVNFLNTELDKIRKQNTTIEDYENNIVTNTETIIQSSNGKETKNQFRANAVYVEPLSKKFFSQTFYNFSNRHETGDNLVRNNDNLIIDNLSRTYDNTIQSHRIGSAVRYAHKGLNLSLGLGYQLFNLNGDYSIRNQDPNNIDKTFTSIIPHFSLNYSPKRGTSYGLSYNLENTEPDIIKLQPIVDNSNPLYITEGNQNLTPATEHTISASWFKFIAFKQVRIGASASYTYLSNDIITNQTVNERLATYVTYQNYKGGNRVNLNSWFGFPIYKNIVKANGNINGIYVKTYSYVNSTLNENDRWGITPSLRFSINAWKGGSINIGTRIGYTVSEYNLNTTQNQTTWDNNYTLGFDTKLASKWYFNSDLEYKTLKNERFGLNQKIPTLNASIYRQFLKGNKAEARLSLYNAFDQDFTINQFADINSVNQSRTSGLGRYVMFSLKYNIKGLNPDKKGMFH